MGGKCQLIKEKVLACATLRHEIMCHRAMAKEVTVLVQLYKMQKTIFDKTRRPGGSCSFLKKPLLNIKTLQRPAGLKMF